MDGHMATIRLLVITVMKMQKDLASGFQHMRIITKLQ